MITRVHVDVGQRPRSRIDGLLELGGRVVYTVQKRDRRKQIYNTEEGTARDSTAHRSRSKSTFH